MATEGDGNVEAGVDADQLIADFRARDVRRVKLGVTDIDGVLRGKYLSLAKFESIAGGTSGFCDCVLGWDMDDQLYDNVQFTGWHTAFPDALYRLDLGSMRRLTDEGGVPYFIGEFVAADGVSGHPLCPRAQLKRAIAALEAEGLKARLAFEYEFFIFRETPHSVREKNYSGLTPLSPGNFGYSVLRTAALSDLFNEFMDYCEDHDFALEGLHCETGPGVWEGAIAVDDALAAADKASLFKTHAKAFFQKRDMMATFMAKWSMDYPGQSGHLHQSVLHTDGLSAFYDAADANGMSALMTRYVGGLQQYLPEFLPLIAPTINSYTRLVKGAWAPTAATWGVENRTTALRVIAGSATSQRVEFRLGSADANPYLVAAANLHAGRLGLAEKIDPDAPIVGNAYDIQDGLPASRQLAANLRDSARGLAASAAARGAFGDEFVDHFVASRLWEVREYERHVNDWQLARYFEIV